MIFHVFTKEGGVGKSELFTNLFDTEICLSQVVTNILQHMFRNPLVGGLARILLAEGREVFRRDAQPAGISFYRVTFHIVGVQQVKKMPEVDFRRHLLLIMHSGRVIQACF